MTTTRAKSAVYLLGAVDDDIKGSKLSSKRQALAYFCHPHLDGKMPMKDAAAQTIDTVTPFWNRARIPMQKEQRCREKVLKLFGTWQALKKHRNRKSATQATNEKAFVDALDDLFDVAHADALSIKNSEDRAFLLAQREKGRRGCMTTVDKTLAEKEKRKEEAEKKAEMRRRRSDEMSASTSAVANLASSSSSSPASSAAEESDDEATGGFGCTACPPKRGRKGIASSNLAAALDRHKVSDRQAVALISETAKNLGHDVKEIALGRSTIRLNRLQHRKESAMKLKENFVASEHLVIHWDGKMMPDITGHNSVDRLPVLVSGKRLLQLLAVPKLPTGTGRAQADAVTRCIKDWDLESNIRAMCFDTTSSNTGRRNGACLVIEQNLGVELLHLACRHHIMELVIGAVFSACMGSSSAPEVVLFKRFQAQWPSIDKADFDDAFTSDDVPPEINDGRHDVLRFIERHLDEQQQRDDYRELLILTRAFLGGGVTAPFRYPGPVHHARWMAKVIYSFKIWLFRRQFQLTLREESGLRDICVFAVRLYLKAWFTAPLAAAAPNSDLELMKALAVYPNQTIGEAAGTKLLKHLWYLSEDLVGLALFDRAVPFATKALMVSAMKVEAEGSEDHRRIPRAQVDLASVIGKTVADFATANSRHIFERLNLPSGFLDVAPEEWEDREDFQQAAETVQCLHVVNDLAERGVALIQKFSGCITHDEEQLQFLIRVVDDHRRCYPDALKRTVAGQQ